MCKYLVDVLFFIDGVEHLHQIALPQLALAYTATPTEKVTTRHARDMKCEHSLQDGDHVHVG